MYIDYEVLILFRYRDVVCYLHVLQNEKFSSELVYAC